MSTELELSSDNLRESHWLGEVVDNQDPLKNGRCKVRVFGKFDSLPNEAIPWATSMTRDNVGSHHIPRVGDIVAVRFDNGNMYHPEYWFQVNQNKELKEELLAGASEPHNVVSIVYDAARNVRIYWSKEDGFVITTGKDKESQPMVRMIDDKIYLNSNNIFIATSKDDESEPAVRGETLRSILDNFMNVFNSHTHPTPTGPSGPPIPPDVTKVKQLQSKLEKIKQKK